MIAAKRYPIAERVFPMSFYLIGRLFGKYPFLFFNLPSAGFPAPLGTSQAVPLLAAPAIVSYIPFVRRTQAECAEALRSALDCGDRKSVV